MAGIALHGVDLGHDGRVVLRDVRLAIGPGERVAIVGRSGSGKSTLLDALYDAGCPHAALIPQAASLVGPLSAFHNVYMGRLDRNGLFRNLRELAWPSRRARGEVCVLLRGLGLHETERRAAATLSGGQAQRVSVARALYAARRVVIGDEPVSALDPHEAARVLRMIQDAHETSIVALHDVGLALGCCTRVIALRGERIALDAPTKGLRADDLNPFYDAP